MYKKYRKALIAGNWKMNMLPSECKAFGDALRAALPKERSCLIAICAPYTHLNSLGRALRDSRVAVGAQDVSVHEKGAYTGEVSAAMLADLGMKYVIVGHSERRQYHGETDEMVNEKAKAVLARGMAPIICVGESLEQRERGLTMEHIAYQVKAALYGIDGETLKKVVIAYEPIWAIGTGKTATAEQAQEVCAAIRETVKSLYDGRLSRGMSILYGGSMNEKNAQELLSMRDIDGGLIGGASLKPESFAAIVAATAQA